MSLYVGEMVHLRGQGGQSCLPLLVINDGAPNYNVMVDGLAFGLGDSDDDPGTVVTALGVPADETELIPDQGYRAAGVAGTWHYRDACPDQPGPASAL